MIIRPGLLRGGGGAARGPAPTFEFDSLTGSLPAGMTLTRASAATYVDGSGAIVTVGVDVPRFTPTGLLIEEAATNLLLNTATLATQGVTVTAVAHTLSFYGTGTVTLSGASTAGPLVGTGANDRVSLTFTPTAGTLTCTVTGSVTSAMLETKTAASSYCPSAGTQGVRARDVPTLPSGLNGATISYAIRFALPSVGTVGGTVLFLSQANSNNDCLRILSIAGNTPTAYKRVAAVNEVTFGRAAVTANQMVSHAFALDAASALGSWDGAVATVDTTLGADLTALNTNKLNAGQANDGPGIILRYLRIWDGKKLSPDQVQKQSARVA